VSLFERRSGRGDAMYPGFARPYREPRAFTVTASLGGFGLIGIAWDAASLDEAIVTFTQFLEDEDEVRRVSPDEVPGPGLRKLSVMFNGAPKILIFRPEWVAGWTVDV
jgi:hypothetical protein